MSFDPLPTITPTEAGSYDLHDADEWYNGYIGRIEEVTNDWGDGFKFAVILDDDGDHETWAFTSQILSSKSKLWGWAKALGWDTITPLNLNDLNRLKCQIMFERYTPAAGGDEKEKVAKMRALKGGGSIPSNTADPDQTLYGKDGDQLEAPF